MTASHQNSKKEKLKRISHFFAGFVILLHGYERWEHHHASHVFFFIAGAVFLSIAIFHHQLAARFPLIDTVFFLIEAFLSFVVAWEYFEAGKKALPFAYLAAGVMQVVAVFIWRRKHGKAG